MFTDVPARCVVLRVRFPGPVGSCSLVCPLGVLFCVCGVLGLVAFVHRCARLVCCVVRAASWATWLLFTGVPTGCVVLRVRCPGPRGSCSPVCCNGSSDSTQFIHQFDQNFNDSQMYISAVNFPLFFMFSVRRQMSPVSARQVAFVFRDFPIGFI